MADYKEMADREVSRLAGLFPAPDAAPTLMADRPYRGEPTPSAAPVTPVATPTAPVETVTKSAVKVPSAGVLPAALGEMTPDFGRFKKAIDVVPSLLTAGQELAKAQADENKAKMEGDALQAREKASALERHAETVRNDIAAQERKLAEFPYPEFHPTKENAQSLGELFSVISTMGVLLGGAGKLSSLNALNAMGGMLKGWQAGRADLFKREKETFDKEFQRIKAIHEDLKRTFDEYMKARVVDKEAAMYKAQELATKAGAGSIIAAQMNVGNAKAVGDAFQAFVNLKKHAEDMEARAAQHRESLASQERLRQATLDAANIRAAIKAGAGEPKASISEMKSGKEKNEMIGKASALGAFDFVINEVEKDPSLVGVIGAARRVGSGASQIPGLGGLADPQVTYIQSFIEAAKTKDYRSFVGSGALSDRDKQNLDKIFATTPLNSAADVKAAFLAAKNILSSSLIGAGFDANEEADVYSKTFSESYGKMSGRPQAAPDTRVYEPKTEEEFNALKPGSLYIDPSDRKQYRKP